jgi:hypothetical protein
MTNQASEMWTPRCPQCGNGSLVLAPANGFTKWLISKVEVYCTNCQYRANLAENLTKIFVRI